MSAWEWRAVLAVVAVFMILMFRGYGQYQICFIISILAALTTVTFLLLGFISTNTASLVAASTAAFLAAIVAAFAAIIVKASATDDASAFDLAFIIAGPASLAAAIVAEIVSRKLKIKYVWAFLGLALEGMAIFAILRYAGSFLAK